MVSMLQIYKFGFDDLILLKPFHTMMSIGRVCYTDVTPFFLYDLFILILFFGQ